MAIEEDKGGVILVKETKEYQTKKAINKNKKHGDKDRKGKEKGRTKDGKRKHRTKKRRSADKKGQDLQQRPSANNRSSKTNLKVEKKNNAGQTPAKEKGVPNDEVEKKHEADKRRPLGQNPQRSDNILPENSRQAEKMNQMKPIRPDGNKVQQRTKQMEQRSKQMEQRSKQMEQRSKPVTRNTRRRAAPKPASKQHRKARNTKGRKTSVGRAPKVITPDIDPQMKPVEEKNDEVKLDGNQAEFQLSVEDVKTKENKVTPSKDDPKESRELVFSKEQADAIQATTPDVPKSQNELTLQTTQPSSIGRRTIPPQPLPAEAGQEPPLGPPSMPPMSKTQNGEITKSDDAKTPRQQQQLPSVPSKPQVFQVTSKTMTKSEQANFLATWHVQPNVAKIGSKTSLNKISQKTSQDRISWAKTEDLPELRMRQQSLVVNVDEVLRLGSVMERQGMTKTRRGAFDWIAMNRTTAHQHPTAFSSQLMTALGDVELEKGLAIKSIDELRAAGTITGPEYLTLKKTIELLIPPVTVGQIAYLVHTEGAYYKQKTK